MAISNNPLLAGASGRIGDIIIRQYKGKTVLSKAPCRSKKPPTKAQKAQRQMFAEAVVFAKAVKHKFDLETKKELKLAAGRNKPVANCKS